MTRRPNQSLEALDRHAANNCNGKCDGESCDVASIVAALCTPLMRHRQHPRPTSDKGTATDDLATDDLATPVASTTASLTSPPASGPGGGGSAEDLARSGVRVTDL